MSTKAPAFQSSEIPPKVKFAIIAARFNTDLVDELLAGCQTRLAEIGIAESRVTVYRVPGAFELPVAAKWAAEGHKFAAVICLGAVVKGDTPHFDYVAGEAASGIAAVSLETGVPVIFGVLTTNTIKQAQDRLGGPEHGHAGERAAEAAVEMVVLKTKILGTGERPNRRLGTPIS